MPEENPRKNAFPIPGFWPGVVEMLVFLGFVTTSAIWVRVRHEADDSSNAPVVVGAIATILLLATALRQCSDRQVARVESGMPFQRLHVVRDVVIFGMAVAAGPLNARLLLELSPHDRASSLVTLCVSVLAFFLASAFWGRAIVGRSVPLGTFSVAFGAALFVLGGVIAGPLRHHGPWSLVGDLGTYPRLVPRLPDLRPFVVGLGFMTAGLGTVHLGRSLLVTNSVRARVFRRTFLRDYAITFACLASESLVTGISTLPIDETSLLELDGFVGALGVWRAAFYVVGAGTMLWVREGTGLTEARRHRLSWTIGGAVTIAVASAIAWSSIVRA
jgi:hypothetical protein